jgi:hypothetical protein
MIQSPLVEISPRKHTKSLHLHLKKILRNCSGLLKLLENPFARTLSKEKTQIDPSREIPRARSAKITTIAVASFIRFC